MTSFTTDMSYTRVSPMVLHTKQKHCFVLSALPLKKDAEYNCICRIITGERGARIYPRQSSEIIHNVNENINFTYFTECFISFHGLESFLTIRQGSGCSSSVHGNEIWVEQNGWNFLSSWATMYRFVDVFGVFQFSASIFLNPVTAFLLLYL